MPRRREDEATPAVDVRQTGPVPDTPPTRIFLLSPANSSGTRGQLLLQSPNVALAEALRSGEGASLGEVFAFISSLYFRGKLAYARAFAPEASYVITPSRGLLPPDTRITIELLREFGDTPIDADEPRYLEPLVRDVERLCNRSAGEVVLLGSVASAKYTTPLVARLGRRLVFPSTFVGRGDMSRGGVLLRAVREGRELEYASVEGATVRGARPARLPPLPRP
jgi:hypothetical protein